MTDTTTKERLAKIETNMSHLVKSIDKLAQYLESFHKVVQRVEVCEKRITKIETKSFRKEMILYGTLASIAVVIVTYFINN